MSDSGRSDTGVPDSLTIDGAKRQREGRRPGRTGLLAGVAAVTFGIWVLYGMFGGPDAAPITPPSPTSVPPTTTTTNVTTSTTTTTTATTAVVTPTTMIPPSGAWNPILATTRAKPSPPSATCPPGTDSNVPGPVDQERPRPGPSSNQSAVFDRHTGRIVYVDEAGETWTFDVCTNTWKQMNPQLGPIASGRPTDLGAELVYDIDSDRTIAFASDSIAVYDANANTWTQRDKPSEYAAGWPVGAVYDPVSGLVVIQTGEAEPVAYNVDTDDWTPLGTLWCSPHMVYDADTEEWTPAELVRGCVPFLIGYSTRTDRLIFLPFGGDGQVVDPRSGDSTPLDEPPRDVAGGFGSFSYATGGETAYTFNLNFSVCRLDPGAQNWECFPRPFRSVSQMPSAMVVDPINDRLVLINDFCCNWPGTETTKDIWALDLDTGDWTQLLASTSP